MLLNKYDKDLMIKNTLDMKLMHLDIAPCMPIPYIISYNLNISFKSYLKI